MPMFDPVRLALSFGLSLLIGGLGYRRRSLTRGGWLGAVVVGTTSAGFGGWAWGALVVVFFATSTALSHWQQARKHHIAADKFAKHERRDLGQTLANGGGIVLLALLSVIAPQPWLFAAALGVLATVTADTWATELGTLSRRPPRLVTTGAVVSAGTSGGVTRLGLAATVLGALVIGVVASALLWLLDGVATLWPIGAALAGGSMGSLSDSVLGATVQAMRWCPQCRVETERRVHRCGTPTEHLRGWRWLDNDWVNFSASLLGGAASVIVWAIAS